jgi:hypothetical protein
MATKRRWCSAASLGVGRRPHFFLLNLLSRPLEPRHDFKPADARSLYNFKVCEALVEGLSVLLFCLQHLFHEGLEQPVNPRHSLVTSFLVGPLGMPHVPGGLGIPCGMHFW